MALEAMTRSVPCGVVVNSYDRNKVVLAFANTLTSSTATRSSKELTDVRENEDLWWCYADG